MQLINIGFGNVVSADKIVSIVSPEAAPIKRMVQEAKELLLKVMEAMLLQSWFTCAVQIWNLKAAWQQKIYRKCSRPL